MRTLFRKIRSWRFRHDALVTITIHRDRILHNLAQFQALYPGVAVAPVLKSNAYGHGLVPVAKILDGAASGHGGTAAGVGSGRIPFLCVDSYVEALILRNEHVRAPILIIGYTPLSNIEKSALKDVAFGVMSLDELRNLAARAKRARRRPVPIHLKIDTGMHRHGLLPEELPPALDLIRRHPAVALEGVYSHLADADTPDSALTRTQIARWNAAARMIKEAIPSVRYFHLSNTAGSGRAQEIDANVMRPGVGLYGINTNPNIKARNRGGRGLLPVLEMRTRITSVRKLASGESMGYNATFIAKRTTNVATIPVGYAEGLDRRLSNKGSVLVRGIACPVVGIVSMNITSVDVSRVPDPKLEDEVVVVSDEPGASNSIEEMAKLSRANPCELFVHLSPQIRRIVVP